jgi:hypothetical protein
MNLARGAADDVLIRAITHSLSLWRLQSCW